MQPAFSIIIPTLNEEHYLPQTLTALEQQNFTGTWEVIVVDGGSEDNTVNVAQGFQGRIPNLRVMEAEKGTSHQRNVGAAEANYPHLIFLDADTVPGPGFLQQLSETLNTTPYVALPFIVTEGKGIRDSLFVGIAYLFFTVIRVYKSLVAGTCLLVTKEIHDTIGGFNEQVRFAEDIEYGFRAMGAGARYRLLYRVWVTTSVRRVRKTGHVRLGLMWLRMYLHTARYGAILEHDGFDYEFGGFKKHVK